MATPIPSTLAALYGHDDIISARAALGGVSVVTPMYQEQGGAVTHVEEITTALGHLRGLRHEIIVVDDGSSDDTVIHLEAARAGGLDFRLLHHHRNAGQSRAIRTGVLAARYPVIVMIDGDGQNDPADIARLVEQFREFAQADTNLDMGSDTGLGISPAIGKPGAKPFGMIAGERQKRQDTGAKKVASKIANQVRELLLKDGAQDSGCGLKVFYRDIFLQLPYFDHIHRYLPFLMKREGFRVEFATVGHRARQHGVSKYTNMGRLGVAFRDLAGVLWLKARSRSPGQISER